MYAMQILRICIFLRPAMYYYHPSPPPPFHTNFRWLNILMFEYLISSIKTVLMMYTTMQGIFMLIDIPAGFAHPWPFADPFPLPACPFTDPLSSMSRVKTIPLRIASHIPDSHSVLPDPPTRFIALQRAFNNKGRQYRTGCLIGIKVQTFCLCLSPVN